MGEICPFCRGVDSRGPCPFGPEVERALADAVVYSSAYMTVEWSKEERMGDMLQVGDLVSVQRRGVVAADAWEGRIERIPMGVRVVLVRGVVLGGLVEVTPEELTLLALRHRGGPDGINAVTRGDEVTEAGAAAGHSVPYETCAKCHPDRGEVGWVMMTGLTPDHSPAGYCDACRWSYCRLPGVRPEPEVRCAGCGIGAPTLNFEGGGCFDYPLTANGGLPESARRGGGEDQPLCPPCAKKTAEFIAHLKVTHGGKR